MRAFHKQILEEDMCGIVGIVGQNTVAQILYDALLVLQHRGQDAAGIVTADNGRFFLRKANGMVNDVFTEKHMRRLQGNVGIGHVRYPTAGSASSAEAQPLYVNSPYGISMVHNGNLTNTEALIADIYATDLRHINTCSDSEVLLNIFAHELSREKQEKCTPEAVFAAVRATHKRVKGAYAVVALISGFGLVAFRDPYGIRPLVYGAREENGEKAYMVASESVALNTQGFELIRDISPSEALIITNEGEIYSQECADNPKRMPCIFEYVYFARPDSTIDGINVYKARLRMGEKLAERIRRDYADLAIDVVIPIPDTSRCSAIELAKCLQIKFREGFMKNRYIGRTFIMSEQSLRSKSVRRKLNTLDLEFRGKNVLLVDDSIVRGTTSAQIVQMAREAGANKVYFASAAPPIRYPNVYGIDMPTHEELIAYGREEAQIAQAIGADAVIFQTLPDLIDACMNTKYSLPEGFDCSVFDGQYITGDIDAQYFAELKAARNNAQSARRSPIGSNPVKLGE